MREYIQYTGGKNRLPFGETCRENTSRIYLLLLLLLVPLVVLLMIIGKG